MATPIWPTISLVTDHRMRLRYENPSQYTCISFGHCRGLRRAAMVSWWELPLDDIATFYETSDCTHQHGRFSVNSGALRDSLDGWRSLQPHQWIRSMMFGPNTGAANPAFIHIPIVRICAFEPVDVRFDSTRVEANETQANITQEMNSSSQEVFAGGLSSNWTHALSDASKDAGSVYGGEVVGASY
jgi:hypothetical protein